MSDQPPGDATLVNRPAEAQSLPTLDGSVSSELAETMEAPSAAPSPARRQPAAPVTLPAEAYAVGAEIARGGMGSILQAEDRKLGRLVAMKVMKLPAAASQGARARFIREATVLARLEHPNIVPIHELGWDAQNRLYYTMKLVQGRTLREVLDGLRRNDPEFVTHYTLDRLLTIFRKICDAMSMAHSKGVIHRDLKPENVMVGEFGEVLVMDWGLAKIQADATQAAEEAAMKAEATQAGSAERFRTLAGTELRRTASVPSMASLGSMTVDGEVMGTPLYMSPEQAEGHGAQVDQQSDIFSLGGILYAILTLHPPVDGKTADEIMTSIKRGDIRPPTVYNTSTKRGDKASTRTGPAANPKQFEPLPHCPAHRVPAALSAVTMRALALDKAKRYKTVAEFAADIEAYQGGFATQAEHAGLITQLRLLVRRHKREFGIAFAAWFVITALAIWFVLHLRASERETRRQAQIAKTNEQKATAAERTAKQAEAVAVQERESARQALAKVQLDLAEKEFERGKYVEAQRILDQTPENFRDANWRFLQANARDFTAQLVFPGSGTLYGLQVLPQADRFVARSKDAIGIFTLAGRQIGAWISTNPKAIRSSFGIDRAGATLAFAASANEIAVHELPTGKLLRRFKHEVDEIEHVGLSPDGQTVVALGKDQVAAYATATGAPLWPPQPARKVIPAFSPNGQTLAIAASASGPTVSVQLLDPRTGTARKTLEAAGDGPKKTSLQFNAAGDRLACLGGDELIVWNATNGRKERTIRFPGEVVSLLNPRGDAVVTVDGNRLRLRDTVTGRVLRSLNGATNEVRGLAFSPDGRTLLSGQFSGSDGVVMFWPVRLGEEIAAVRTPTSGASRVLFNHDGSRFYACCRGGAVAWEARGGLEQWKYSGTKFNLAYLAVSPTDGSVVLSEMGKPKLTHLSSAGEALTDFGVNENPRLEFSRSGRLLLAVAWPFDASAVPNWFRVIEYPAGRTLGGININHPYPFATFCLADTAVASAARAGGITFWNWQLGKPIRQIPAAQTGSIGCLAASRDGLHLASGGPDRWIRIWEAQTGRLESAFRAHWEGVNCVKFSPDGREILSGGEDGTVRIHDAATGEQRLALYGHVTPVVDVDFSPDGTLIAAITAVSGYAKVWERKLSSAKTPTTAKTQPTTRDAEGWEDLLSRLTPELVQQTGHGWILEDGVMFSPNKKFAAQPLSVSFGATSYQMRVKLRQVATARETLFLSLPVADRMVGFDLDGWPPMGFRTGVSRVGDKFAPDLSGVVKGKVVNDFEPHDLQVTVRLDGPNATVSSTLDSRPLYEWTGPIASLSLDPNWATRISPGTLALGTFTADWAVSQVKARPIATTPTTATTQPSATTQPTTRAAQDWEDLLAPLTPDVIAETGHGWRMKDGEFYSPSEKFATLPLPGSFADTDYQVRVKLRQLNDKQVFHVVLPVGGRMTGFELEGWSGQYTGLNNVNGKKGKDLPGAVEGNQVKDTEPHELEVTVRLEGANATISATLDAKPLYEWTGPTADLGQTSVWATTPPGSLALGTYADNWAVSEVKVKRQN